LHLLGQSNAFLANSGDLRSGKRVTFQPPRPERRDIRFAIEKMIKPLELEWERYLLELGWERYRMCVCPKLAKCYQIANISSCAEPLMRDDRRAVFPEADQRGAVEVPGWDYPPLPGTARGTKSVTVVLPHENDFTAHD
jgi:hypothetical protein